MAIDTWLLEQHCLGQMPPTLRFYTWDPAAISLGYHQRRYPPEWQEIRWQGQPLDIVRRPSGGRAVLHQGDLTYAIVASGFVANRLLAYQQICEFLIQGWRSLGVELTYGKAGRGYIHNPNCFGTATAADLVMPNGAKLIGSAQLRRGDTILQHGSMPLQQDPVLYKKVFAEQPQLPELQSIDVSMVITALTEAALQCFRIEFDVQLLSAMEWLAIEAVIQRQSTQDSIGV